MHLDCNKKIPWKVNVIKVREPGESKITKISMNHDNLVYRNMLIFQFKISTCLNTKGVKSEILDVDVCRGLGSDGVLSIKNKVRTCQISFSCYFRCIIGSNQCELYFWYH